MSQGVYFSHVSGVGPAAAKTKAERTKLADALEEEERRRLFADQLAETQAHYRLLDRQRQFGNLPYADLSNVAALGAVVFTAAQQQVISDLAASTIPLNNVKTDFINSWASRTSTISNTPFRDQQLMAKLKGPDGKPLFDDPSQAQEFFRHRTMIAALFKHYQVSDQVKAAAEQHLQTAREVVDSVFPKPGAAVANKKINEAVNPSAEVVQTAEFEKAKQALELRIALQTEVERNALAGGMSPDSAKILAAEVTAAFLREQASRDIILREMMEEQARVQTVLKEMQTKQELAAQAARQRRTAGDDSVRPETNIGVDTQAALDQQRALEAEQGKTGPPNDPTIFADGAYTDPHRKKDKPEVEKDQTAELDARIAAFDEQGRPSAVLGAALGGAAERGGKRHGPAARTVSTIETNGEIGRVDGLGGHRFGPIQEPGTYNNN